MFERTIVIILSILLSAVSPGLCGVPPEEAIYEITTIDEEVIIDGELNETFWSEVQVIDEFVQYRPDNGEPPEFRTEVRFARDSDNLYISWVCFADKDELVMNVNTRDYFINNDDCIDILIDTFDDHTNCYDFMVSAGGTQYDGKLINNGEDGDNSWDGVWDSAVTRQPDRYIVEMEIPFRTLRYSQNNDRWGVQLYRVTHQGNHEDVYWAGSGSVNRVSEFGHICGMNDLPGQSPLDITPYGVVRVNKGIDDGGILSEKYERDYEAGMDVELRVGTWMTVNGTLNPDYAHIESDPFEINLSPDQIEYVEKRPFFLEGMEIFNNPLYLVYTRSLTDIIGGVKAVGSIGGSEFAFFDVQLTEDDPFYPESNVMMGRFKQNFGRGSVGGLIINRWRDTGWEDYEDYNRVLSFDTRYQIGDVSPYFQIAKSFIYQDEDMTDGERDELAYELGVRVLRERLNLGFGYNEIQKDFTDDIGFIHQGRKNKRGVWGWGNYQFMINKMGIRALLVNGWGNYFNTIDRGERALRYFGGNTTLSFVNSMGIDFYVEGGYYGMYKEIDGTEYDIYNLGIGYYCQNQPWGGFNFYYKKGDDFGVRYNGFEIQSTLIPVRGLNIDYSFDFLRDMDENQNIWTNRLMATHYLTRDLYWRFIYDASSDYIHEFSGLLGYTYLPGSTLYVAYEEIRDRTTGEMELQDRIIFMKCSYQLAI